jgi:hypothetical protein
MLARYDSESFRVSSCFSLFAPDIQNELIHSISELMTMEIEKEILRANFVSSILDETSDVMMKCQLAMFS